MQNYASLQETQDQEEQGILYHVSEPTRSRWNHIDDLDSFFSRLYKYHQSHGFACMLLQEIFGLHQYVFVVCLTVYLIYGIDYQTLFRESTNNNSTRVTIRDVMLPVADCIDQFSLFTWFVVTMAAILFVLKVVVKFYQMILFWDIKQFYNTALNVKDDDLDNLTWYEIQNKIKAVQLEQQMCIHKRELTELDIHQRILRQENYLIAMVNKKLLPPRFTVPVLGEIVYWTKGLRYNVIGLFFWSPWAPFENPWHLREEYKRQSLRQELAAQLGKQILWLAILNFILSPLILIWQILFYFFNYFELVRREPGKFGIRYWSMYANLYIRHFNELDHELHVRLTRAYRPASKYLSAFSSPIATVTAQHVAFLCSSVLAVFLILSFYDNEVIYVEQVISVIAFLTGVIAICRNIVPAEGTVWCPEALLEAVVLHTHYMPEDWQDHAHTSKIKNEFQQLFQYRFAALLEEFLSPILTPYCLVRYIYPRSLDIVDFFRNFTVSVVGVGDVCSFAQMDIVKHGNPYWNSDTFDFDYAPNQYTQAEDGKVELSLMHFTSTNPDWIPPREAQEFVESVQGDLLLPQNDQFRGSVYYDSGSAADFERYPLPEPRRSILSSVAWRPEGPDMFSSAHNMRASTLFLHNRRARQSIRRTQSLEETTPLLSVDK